jgi:protein-arginine kinase activator protein McsA
MDKPQFKVRHIYRAFCPYKGCESYYDNEFNSECTEEEINKKIEKHMDKCKFNPEKKSCPSCKHSFEDFSDHRFIDCKKKIKNFGFPDGLIENCKKWKWNT